MLKEVERAQSTATAQTDARPVVPMTPPDTPPKQKRRATQRRAIRLAVYQQVWNLRSQGWSGKAIAQELGISPTTVFRYLRSSTFPERQGRSDRGRSLLDPYKDYVLSCGNDGCHDPKRLFEEIQQAGYTGTYDTVARYTRRLRSSQGVKLRKRLIRKPLPKVSEPSKRSLTPGRVRTVVLRRPEAQEPEDEHLVARLKAGHPDLAEAIELAQQFAALVRQRLPEQLDSWIDKAKNSSVSLLRRFALGLESDYDALKAGVTFSTSNGPVEGQINRLKMLKRQMFGRAGLDLLTRRFLLAL